LGAKRKRKKSIVIPGEGDACPRCGQPMQIRQYDGLDEEQPVFIHPLVLLHERGLQNHFGDALPL
jgi:hypothetical protein